eukprot:m.29834 g.29834  ORF g.29834 m.29834 type:complete len:131 (+) comp11979_c0_seq2:526-918(+)
MGNACRTETGTQVLIHNKPEAMPNGQIGSNKPINNVPSELKAAASSAAQPEAAHSTFSREPISADAAEPVPVVGQVEEQQPSLVAEEPAQDGAGLAPAVSETDTLKKQLQPRLQLKMRMFLPQLTWLLRR